MLLLFLLPGTVYQFVRSRLRGPHPDDASALNRVLRAVGVSTGLATVYAWALGPQLLDALRSAQQSDEQSLDYVRPLALYALALLFLIPAGVALVVFLVSQIDRSSWPTWTKLTYDPTPRAWDWAFAGVEPSYVRILTADGRYLGGWYGASSFVSSYPEPREMFIEVAHYMDESGEFGDEVPGSNGMYVRCDDIRLVEFIGVAADDATGHTGSSRGPRNWWSRAVKLWRLGGEL
jgi:hypothetical protein